MPSLTLSFLTFLSILNDTKSDMITRCEGKFQRPTQEHEKKTETATNYSKLWKLHEENTYTKLTKENPVFNERKHPREER